MPTVSLIDAALPAGADAWHRVHAPGGYEAWYFDAEDISGRYRIVAALMDGGILHPGYMRRYRAFIARPTRVLPPLPREFPCVYFWIHDAQGVSVHGMTQFAAADFLASDKVLDVRIGPHWTRLEDGAISVHLENHAQLTFRPRVSQPAVESAFLSRQITGSEHHWLASQPLCDVLGQIHLGDQAIEFSGMGYHEHLYGAGPIGPGLKRWMRGRVLGPDRAVAFHLATAQDSTLGDEAQLLNADSGGAAMSAVKNLSASWDRRNLWGMAYPSRVDLDDELHLRRPRVIFSSPVGFKLEYEAMCNGQAGTAFCELAYPQRLGWPVVGRMIERQIRRGVK